MFPYPVPSPQFGALAGMPTNAPFSGTNQRRGSGRRGRGRGMIIKALQWNFFIEEEIMVVSEEARATQ